MYRKIKAIITECLLFTSPTLISKILYKTVFNKELDLKNPITLNEKVMWLKLNTYYKNDLVTKCADKYKVREYIEESGNSELLNDLISSWGSVEEIDWDSLPQKFVMKCNHGAGYNIICRDKSRFNVEEAKITLSKWMKEDYWKFRAETNYKYIPKKIICEKFLETSDGELPEDYKIYCFNGKATCVMVCTGREKGYPKFYYFNKNWELLPFSTDALNVPADFKLEKPDGFEKMFEYAEKLAKPFPFVRVDFYLIEGEVIFGELTFTPGAALDKGRLESTDRILGDSLNLSANL
ncbi:MAG: ATP-grasp fold amidoligase family protein [Solibacillus sp.]